MSLSTDVAKIIFDAPKERKLVLLAGAERAIHRMEAEIKSSASSEYKNEISIKLYSLKKDIELLKSLGIYGPRF